MSTPRRRDPRASGALGIGRGARAAAVAGGPVVLAVATLLGEPALHLATKTAGTDEVAAELSVSVRPGPTPLHWDIPIHRTRAVERWIHLYTHDGRPYFQTWLDRMSRYETLIRRSLRRRGMPEDLVYVALIESGFSPFALSAAHATGLWQFMPRTAREHGLEVNEYVDDRLDPIRSTEAALDFLEELHERFGSWYLAAAAYNAGPGRVRHDLVRYAGVRTGGSDSLFFAIASHLPRETRQHVPRLVAAAILGKDPSRYGFDLQAQAPLDFEVVFVPGRTSLSDVAAAAGASVESIEDLNPQLIRGETPPGLCYPVRIPVGSTREVLAALSNVPRAEAKLALASE